jgi:hypothetical protein
MYVWPMELVSMACPSVVRGRIIIIIMYVYIQPGIGVLLDCHMMHACYIHFIYLTVVVCNMSQS